MAQIDNPTFAAGLEPLLAALIANPSSGGPAFVSGLTTLLNEWATTTSVGAQVLAQNLLLSQMLGALNAAGIKGQVDTIADLPAGQSAGTGYQVLANNHLYVFNTQGQWQDFGVAGTSLDLTNISPAGLAKLNQLILEQQWFLEG